MWGSAGIGAWSPPADSKDAMLRALVEQLVASRRFLQPWEIFALLKDPAQGLAFLSGLERMAEKSARV